MASGELRLSQAGGVTLPSLHHPRCCPEVTRWTGSSRLAAGGLLTCWGPNWAVQTLAWVGCGGAAIPGGQGPEAHPLSPGVIRLIWRARESAGGLVSQKVSLNIKLSLTL